MLSQAIENPASIGVGLKVEKMDLDVVAHNVFGIETESILTGISGQVSANIPYIFSGVTLDGRNLLTAAISIRMVNNRIKMSIQSPFIKDAINMGRIFELAQVAMVQSPLRLRYSLRLPLFFGIHSLQIGPSEKTASRMLSKVRVNLQVDKLFLMGVKASAAFARNTVGDVIATVTPTGLFATAQISIPPALPVGVRFKEMYADLRLHYQRRDVQFSSATVKIVQQAFGGQPMLAAVHADVDVSEDGLGAMVDLIARLLSGTECLSPVRLGWIRIVGSNGAKFDAFESGVIRGPEFSADIPNLPIGMFVTYSGIFKGGQFPFDFTLGINNSLFIGIDVGQMFVSVANNGASLLRVKNEGPMVILNDRQSLGGGQNPLNGTYRSFLDFNPIEIIGRIPLLLNMSEYRVDVVFTMANGAPVAWLNDVTHRMARPSFIRKLGPAVLTLASGLKYDILGVKINGIPALKNVVDILKPLLGGGFAEDGNEPANLTEHLIRRMIILSQPPDTLLPSL
jgi:hypothetical protein